MIIGITGNARHGKDTLAKTIKTNLEKINLNIPISIIHLSEPMKEAVRIIFNWNQSQIENEKDQIDPQWGISPRQALQSLGTDWGQKLLCKQYDLFQTTTGRLLWMKRLISSINNPESLSQIHIISDVRFLHEVEYLRTIKNSMIIKIIRSNYSDSVSHHSSEEEIEKIQADYTILNSDTIETLSDKTKFLIDTIYSNLKPEPKLTLYISGPISSMGMNWEQNFMTAKNYLISKGYNVITPHEIQTDNHSWEGYMRADISQMMTCDGVYMLKNWEQSKGARIEHFLADSLNMKIYYEGEL